MEAGSGMIQNGRRYELVSYIEINSAEDCRFTFIMAVSVETTEFGGAEGSVLTSVLTSVLMEDAMLRVEGEGVMLRVEGEGVGMV